MTHRPIKAWKSFDEQLMLLKQRGLIIEDERKALGYLKSIGYYRLSGYWYPFRQPDSDNTTKKLSRFIENSRFDDVRKLYIFDKKLRQLALDALERIEVAVRVNISHLMGEKDPMAYKKSIFFVDVINHQKWLAKHQNLIARESSTGFIHHHFTHYGDVPIWVTCEIWDFGTMSMLFKGMQEEDKDRIAKIYHLKSGRHLQSYLHAFNIIRNISAHHSRLWNKAIPVKASLKGLKDEQWRQLKSEKPFVYFCLMKYMLDVICPNSTWGSRFLAVLEEFPPVENQAIDLKDMGVEIEPRKWQLWQP